jgi:NAD(P)-dependent dehydrogenase (short-subunit alcohol dehydrogenase family)
LANLEGRRILVTGAAGGQGRAVVRRLVDAGARVAATDLAGRALDELAAALGPAHLVRAADVTREDDVRTLCAAGVAELGGLDGLYNNAGVYWHDRDAPVDELPLEVWEDVLRINATGAYLCCKHALPSLRASGRGVIVNVSSTAGHAGDPACHAYAASKGALLALTRSIAQRYGVDGLRAIALCPGFVETPMVGFALADPAVADHVRRSTALGRLGQPEEIAEVAAFLLSDAASFVTSAVIDAHGGLIKCGDWWGGSASSPAPAWASATRSRCGSRPMAVRWSGRAATRPAARRSWRRSQGRAGARRSFAPISATRTRARGWSRGSWRSTGSSTCS